MPFITDHTWTPTTYRAALAAWRANAPANDSDIFPRAARNSPDKPLAGRLAGVLAYRRLAEPESSDVTNWLVPAGDEDDANAAPDVERALDCGLSPERLMEEISAAFRPFVRTIRGKVVERNDGTVEWGGAVPTRIGRLEFSDGERHERVTIRDELGRIRRGSRRVPRGGLLDQADGFGKPKGGDGLGGRLQATTAQRPAPAPRTHADDMVERQETARVLAALSVDDRRVLDTVLEARTWAALGAALGCDRRTARKRLEAANDNVLAAVRAA